MALLRGITRNCHRFAAWQSVGRQFSSCAIQRAAPPRAWKSRPRASPEINSKLLLDRSEPIEELGHARAFENVYQQAPASESLSLMLNFEEPQIDRLNELRTAIAPQGALLLYNHARTSLYANMPNYHIDTYIKTLETIAAETHAFPVSPGLSLISHPWKWHANRGHTLNLKYRSLHLTGLHMRMLQEWAPKVRMLETDFLWKYYFRPSVLCLPQLSDQQLEMADWAFKHLYPEGFDLGRATSFSLYQRAAGAWAPRTPEMGPEEHDCNGMTLIRKFDLLPPV